MEETIKNIEVIAYKGMEIDMTCKGFQYEVGKTYKTDKVKLCERGFHACLNPKNLLGYYSRKTKSRYFKVKLSGEITKCYKTDTKVAATEMTILEEINIDEIIETTEWWKHENVLDLLYFSDGLARVQRGDGLWNLIDKNGKILSDEWFGWLGNFFNGLAVVQREDNQYNFIDTKGKILSKQWFSDAHSFKDGLAVVQRGDSLYNFIDKQGNFLSKEWFNWVDDFYDGVTRVQIGDGKLVKIDKTGKFIKNCSRIWEKSLKICNRIWKRFI